MIPNANYERIPDLQPVGKGFFPRGVFQFGVLKQPQIVTNFGLNKCHHVIHVNPPFTPGK